MKRLIIVSNRLPVKINKSENGFNITPSAGGLVTGLKSYHKKNNSVWIGWPGMAVTSKEEEKIIAGIFSKERYIPIFLNKGLIENFYEGFSNATIWPLFHYFTEYSDFRKKYWKAYQKVNEMFAETVIANTNEQDTVWVHDYQLLLLPHILKVKRPDLRIGFFLHIPFPSFEVFRILPWRNEILTGMLGADLIGFHTYDYGRHFISSTKRLLGYDVNFNEIRCENRRVYIDAFPMGIDYEKFQKRAYEIQNKPKQKQSKENQDINRFLLTYPNRKLILSIDRLDYTKGLPERLKAFRLFLKNNPGKREKVSLMLLIAPSRVNVERYQVLKRKIEELVSSINGEFGSLNWIPVIYFYRFLPFENLVELYCASDIALITPLRDGMNLVAKEYLAAKTKNKGVLILSEMAGASKELGEAIIVNPNNIEDVSNAIHRALTMTNAKQSKAIIAMQERIKRYDIYKWTSDFINELEKTEKRQAKYQTRKVSSDLIKNFKDAYIKAQKKVLFLDYDGTLQQFYNNPEDAFPDKELYDILNTISSADNTELVLISGRDKETFNQWFGDQGYMLIAEHGAWIKEKDGTWKERKPEQNNWKENVIPLLESYVDRTPGSFIEEKSQSLVWHYRKADIELGTLRALELRDDASNIILNQDLEILEGKKVIEIKVTGIDKGSTALEFLQNKNFDFIMAIGDDWTDELLFQKIPDSAHTIKVGTDISIAKYYVDTYKDVRELLKTFYDD